MVHIADAQRDVREVYRGGFHGQVVSGILWLVAATAATAGSPRAGMITLLLGGTLIFPATTLALKLSGGPASLPPHHPMRALATQIAFTVPFGLLVAAAAAGYRQDWFFPASMVIVGAHYLPFVFLYGMRLFAVLGTVLTFGGVALAVWIPAPAATGGFATGVVLLAFAILLRREASAGR